MPDECDLYVVLLQLRNIQFLLACSLPWRLPTAINAGDDDDQVMFSCHQVAREMSFVR